MLLKKLIPAAKQAREQSVLDASRYMHLFLNLPAWFFLYKKPLGKWRWKRFGIHPVKFSFSVGRAWDSNMLHAEMFLVSRRDYFGQAPLCSALLQPTEHVGQGRQSNWLFATNLNSFTPSSYFLLILFPHVCDPIPPPPATRGSPEWREERKSLFLSLSPPKLLLQEPPGLYNKHLISSGKQ